MTSVVGRIICGFLLTVAAVLAIIAAATSKWSTAKITLDMDVGGGTTSDGVTQAGESISIEFDIGLGLKDICVTGKVNSNGMSQSQEQCNEADDVVQNIGCPQAADSYDTVEWNFSNLKTCYYIMIVGCGTLVLGVLAQTWVMCSKSALTSTCARILPRVLMFVGTGVCAVAMYNYSSIVTDTCGTDVCTVVETLGSDMITMLALFGGNNPFNGGSGSGSSSSSSGDFNSGSNSGSGSGNGIHVPTPTIVCTQYSACFILSAAACVLTAFVFLLNFCFAKPSPAEEDEAMLLAAGQQSTNGGYVDQNVAYHRQQRQQQAVQGVVVNGDVQQGQPASPYGEATYQTHNTTTQQV